MAALELDRHHVDAGLLAEEAEVTVHSHPDMFFPIWAYYEMAADSGSPAYSLAELMAAGEQAREAADQESVRTMELTAEPVVAPRVDRGGLPPKPLSEGEGHARTLGACLALVPELGRTATFRLELPPGGFSYRTAPTTTVNVKLGRFADQTVTELPPVSGSAEVAIPRDAAAVPWQAEIRTAARVLACAR